MEAGGGIAMIKALGILLLLLAAVPLQAQIKKSILHDCSAARLEFERALPEERQALIPYLKLVLQLESHSERKFESRLPQIAGSPGLGGAGFAADDFLNTLDGPRKLEARICAMSLLEKAGLLALPVLPQITRLADDGGLPFPLQEMTRRTAVRLAALSAAQPDSAEEQQALSGLVDILAGGGGFYAQAVVCELGERALPVLFKRLPKSPEISREQMSEAVLCIDPDGALAGPWLLELLKSGDETLRLLAIRMLGDLPSFYRQALPALIKPEGDISPEVHKEALSVLERIFKSRRTSGIRLEPGALRDWLAALQKAAQPERAILTEGLVLAAAGSPGLEREVLALMDEPDIDLRVRLLASSGMSPIFLIADSACW